jgi:AcrR family transcriptional regulator
MIDSEPTTAGRPDTRARILTAGRDLIVARHPSALSVAEIARSAGVSHRTVYRYYPTKEALIEAVAERPLAPDEELPFADTWAEAPGALRVVWRMFARHLDDLRGERMVPYGIELRRARYQRACVLIDAILRDAGIPEGPELDSLREVVVLLTSSTTLLELVDRHGLDVDRSVDVVVDAVRRLVSSATRDARRVDR